MEVFFHYYSSKMGKMWHSHAFKTILALHLGKYLNMRKTGGWKTRAVHFAQWGKKSSGTGWMDTWNMKGQKQENILSLWLTQKNCRLRVFSFLFPSPISLQDNTDPLEISQEKKGKSRISTQMNCCLWKQRCYPSLWNLLAHELFSPILKVKVKRKVYNSNLGSTVCEWQRESRREIL